MENNNFTSKNLIKVLNRFLMPNFHLTSDTYMELLISHLAKPENKGQIHTSDHWPVHLQVLQFKAYFHFTDLTQLQSTIDWIKQSVNQITGDQPQNLLIYAFTLRLLAIVIDNNSATFADLVETFSKYVSTICLILSNKLNISPLSCA